MKKMKLETAFIKYGKYKMVNFIRAEITDKINHAHHDGQDPRPGNVTNEHFDQTAKRLPRLFA